MLSYRHAYHAGNHADVLKHLVLSECLNHLSAKDKPFLVLDTHAGAGLYDLGSSEAQRTGEGQQGIGRLWGRHDLPESLGKFRDLLKTLNPNPSLRTYPGSPWFARALTRPGDRLHFCELHSTDFAYLKREFGKDAKRCQLMQADGFEAMKSLLPPPSRRGLVIIDPSYEIKSDYVKVSRALKDALGRFATGTFLVWHPLLPLLDAHSLPDKLKKTGARHWLHATLQVKAPSTQGRGMHGSGMFVINPPWRLAATLQDALPFLASILAQDTRADWSLEHVEDTAPKGGAIERQT